MRDQQVSFARDGVECRDVNTLHPVHLRRPQIHKICKVHDSIICATGYPLRNATRLQAARELHQFPHFFGSSPSFQQSVAALQRERRMSTQLRTLCARRRHNKCGKSIKITVFVSQSLRSISISPSKCLADVDRKSLSQRPSSNFSEGRMSSVRTTYIPGRRSGMTDYFILADFKLAISLDSGAVKCGTSFRSICDLTTCERRNVRLS